MKKTQNKGGRGLRDRSRTPRTSTNPAKKAAENELKASVLKQLNPDDLRNASVDGEDIGWQLVKAAEKFIDANEVEQKYVDAIYHRPDKWAGIFIERLYPGGIKAIRGHKAANISDEELAQARASLYAQFAKAVRRSKELKKQEIIFINIDESPTKFAYQSTFKAKLFARKENVKHIERPVSKGQVDNSQRTSAQLAHSTSPAFNREVLIPSFMMCQKGGKKMGKRGKLIQNTGSVENKLEKAFAELGDAVPKFRPRIYSAKGTVTKKIFLKEMEALAKKMESFAFERNYEVYYVLLIDAASTHKHWQTKFPDDTPREVTR